MRQSFDRGKEKQSRFLHEFLVVKVAVDDVLVPELGGTRGLRVAAVNHLGTAWMEPASGRGVERGGNIS